MLLAPSIDLDLIAVFNHPGTPALDAVMVAASSRVVGFFALLALGGAIALRSPQRWTGAVLLALSVVGTDALAARVIKPLLSRERPCAGEPPWSEAPGGCQSGHSMPSNHAANAAAAATIAFWALPRFGPAGVLLAALVGLSRVYLGQHWPTDVLAGQALGAAVAGLLIVIVRLRHTVRVRPEGPR